MNVFSFSQPWILLGMKIASFRFPRFHPKKNENYNVDKSDSCVSLSRPQSVESYSLAEWNFQTFSFPWCNGFPDFLFLDYAKILHKIFILVSHLGSSRGGEEIFFSKRKSLIKGWGKNFKTELKSDAAEEWFKGQLLLL